MERLEAGRRMKMAQNTKNTLKNTTAFVEGSEANQKAGEQVRANISLFDIVDEADGHDVQSKVAFMGDIRQKLAEVADAAKATGEQSAATEGLAANAATRLFLARKASLISGEELTGMLGDTFGYKPKQDGTPGKTPAGTGEAIRKRIVRAMQGFDYVNGGDGGRFFETMDADDVAPIINSIGRTKKTEKGEIVPDGPTVWHAYKLLGDLKSQGTVRLPLAFDAKKIIGLTESLSEAGARDKLLGNPSLVRAYKGLFDQLRALTTIDANEASAVRERLGIVEQNETEADEASGEEMAA